MSKDYAKKIKNPLLQPKKKPLPVISIVLGLLFVLVIIFIVYKIEKTWRQHVLEQQVRLVKKGVQLKSKLPVSQTPKFDFYTILPKEQVWLPKSVEAPLPDPKGPSAPVAYFLQVAAFRNSNDADVLKAKLLLKAYPAQVKTTQSKSWYEVWLGPYKSLAQVQSVQVNVLESEHLNGLILQIAEKGSD